MTEADDGAPKRFGHWLRDRPRLPLAVGIGWVVYLASQANIARVLGPTTKQLIALQTATSHERMVEVIGSWTAVDHANFAAHLPPDILHALIYPVVLAVSLAWGFRAAGVPRRFDWLLCLPFLAGAMDQTENAAHHIAVGAAPDVPLWAWAVGLCGSLTKWAIAFTGVAALLVLTVLGIRRRGTAEPTE